ncbi:Rab3 GTPase-activating protein regulatory subunit N-terminus-domain-containing protein [Entophlyctis helioformis]|nr:Rab3 GTPase-activating protein regulatory subunit N-terminus-domain-containing protein [Entophlyctis helioformis]
MVSMSFDASSIICAARRQFVIFQLKQASGTTKYEQVGQGSGCDDPSEMITACLCIPLYIPSKTGGSHMSMCFAVGYSNGYLRVFDMSGTVLIAQQLHTASVQTIKLRTVVAFGLQETDEILVCYSDRRATSIDGTSFWMAARLAQPSSESAKSPSLTYKKWSFQSQEQISDIISCGPAPNSTFFAPQFNNLTGNYMPVNYIARYIAVGRPMVAMYATTETSRSFLAGIVSNKVTNAVTSASSSASSSGSGDQHLHTPATPIPSVLVLADPQRYINSISLAPPSLTSPHPSLAVMTDSLGRVLLMDTEEGEIVRMWKGIRDAQVGWIQVVDEAAGTSKPVILVLAIYNPRGVLELYLMRHRQRIAIVNPGAGMRLVQTAPGVLGGMYWRLAEPHSHGPLASCFLVSPTGDVRKIQLSYAKVETGGKHATLAGDTAKQHAVTVEMEQLIKSLPDATQQLHVRCRVHGQGLLALVPMTELNALTLLSNDIPERTHLNILREMAAASGMTRSTLLDTLETTSMHSKVSQQSQEVKAALETSLRIHLLEQYGLLQQDRATAVTNDAPDQPRSELVNQLSALFAALDVREDGARVETQPPAPTRAKTGPTMFTQAFAINRRWIPGNAGAHLMPLKLSERLDGDAIAALAELLFVPAISGKTDLGSIIAGMLLAHADWATLVIKYFKSVPFVRAVGSDAVRLAGASAVLSLIMQTPLGLDLPVTNLLLDYAWTTRDLGYAMFVSTVVGHVLGQQPETQDLRDERSQQSTLSKILATFAELYRGLDGLAIPCAAAELGKTERTCLSRLVAVEQQRISDRDRLSPDACYAGLEKLAKVAGIANRSLATVYLVFEYADRWIQQSDLDGLQYAVAIAQRVSDTELQQAVGLGLFSHCFTTKLANLIDTMEKTRRVPKDQMCERLCGMAAARATRFLTECVALLEMMEVSQTVTTTAMRAIVHDLAFDPLTSHQHALGLLGDTRSPQAEREYLNDACGLILARDTDSPTRPHATVCSVVVTRHSLMASILLMTFTHDIKPVRPMRMFAPNTVFCERLLSAPLSAGTGQADTDADANSNTLALANPKISAERISFVAKLAETDRMQAKVIANAFGLQSDRIGSLGATG